MHRSDLEMRTSGVPSHATPTTRTGPSLPTGPSDRASWAQPDIPDATGRPRCDRTSQLRLASPMRPDIPHHDQNSAPRRVVSGRRKPPTTFDPPATGKPKPRATGQHRGNRTPTPCSDGHTGLGQSCRRSDDRGSSRLDEPRHAHPTRPTAPDPSPPCLPAASAYHTRFGDSQEWRALRKSLSWPTPGTLSAFDTLTTRHPHT